MLNLLHEEKLSIFYAYIPAHFGVIDPATRKPPSITAGE
jgi:hypothetical protein